MRQIKKSLISLLLILCLTISTVSTASASITVGTIVVIGAAVAAAGVTTASVLEEPRGGMFDAWYKAPTTVAYSSGTDTDWAYGNQRKEFSPSKPCYVRIGSAVQALWHWGWWWGEGGDVVITYRLTGINTCDVEVSDGFLTSVESEDPNVMIFTKAIKAKKGLEEEAVILQITPKGPGSLSLEVIYDDSVRSEHDVRSTVYFVDDTDYE